jgi:hypothetical protein
MSPEARERSFDELAKGLASGNVSRGQALRLMGAALVGGTLASIPGIASAKAPLRLNGRKCKQSSQCASGNCEGGECSAFLGNGENCIANEQCVSRNCSTDGVCSVGGGGCPTNCQREDRADGTGTVCIDCSVGCTSALTDCSQCPEGTTCVTGGSFGTLFGCGVACS